MNRIVTSLLAITFLVTATGCASMSQPNVYAYPTKGQSAEQSSRDQTECQAWAQQQTGFDPTSDTAKGAGLGALIGAAVGAATGAAVSAVTGSLGKGAAIGAAVGGIGGGFAGGARNYSTSKEGYYRAYGACMSTRGYTVR